MSSPTLSRSGSTPGLRPRIDGAPLLPDGLPAFVLSADGADSLAAAAAQLRRYLTEHPQVPLPAVAAALVATRDLRRHRAIVHTDDRGELVTALDALAADPVRPVGTAVPGLHTGVAAAGAPAFVFPGQGSQRRGMGALFHRESAVYRDTVEKIHAIALEVFGSSARDYLLGTGEWEQGGRPVPVEVVQPAIFMQALGLAAMWRAAGIEPRIHVGHSQGEIAAAVAAGTVGLADGLRLVTRRALAVRDNAPTGHSMAVLGTDRERCAAMLARTVGFAELSVVNSAHVLCVSGERDVVAGLVAQATERGIFAREIRVEYPAHTSLVGSMWHLREKWMGVMDHPAFLPTEHLLIGGTLGEAVPADTDFLDYWFWNLKNPVRFDLATRAALDAGADRLIELAEHPTLQLALHENIADAGARATVTGSSRRDATDLSEFSSAVADVLVTHARDLDVQRTLVAEELPPGFPAAPLSRQRLWAALPGRPATAGPVRPRTRVLDTVWTDLDAPVSAPPRPLAIIDPTGAHADLAAALLDAAARYGTPARRSDRAGDDEIAVVLVPGSAETDTTIAAVGELLADRRWWAGVQPAAGIAAVTAGAVVADPADPGPDGAAAAIAVGFRAFGADLPGVEVRHLDLDPRADAAAQAGTAIHALHVAGEPRLALRSGAVRAERWVDAEPTETGTEPPAGLLETARNVVISGGTGHLGLAFAAHAAAHGAASVTLLSRSGGGTTVRHALARIARRHPACAVTVVPCDVTDPAAVATALAGAGRAIDLVVHAAVGYRRCAATDLDASDFTAAAAAKVGGLRTLAQAVPDATLLTCSSAAAALPGAGQAWYAASNTLAEAEAAALRRAGRRAAAVRWGLWEQAGPLDEAGFAAVTAAGVIPLAAPDALAALARSTGPEPVITAVDLPRLRDVAAAFGAAALLTDLTEDTTPAVPAPSDAVPGTAPDAPATVTVTTDAAPGPAPGGGADVAAVLRHHLARALAVPADTLDPDVALVALGLDSLQALELRTAVRDELDAELPLEAILGGATLAEVSATLAG
ncbi:Acyl transferase OS=Tsukamurella paurometabola (strain ATCC 8368 / DSM / CCUG 35730 / CIP 100753/ JCM 10117 / KCTC 9821 / NBRC 16120 / NCIMB 702349 / NCTC 13040) OX=521096 GN=Tpau_4321 PE=4 SV=1 [Tsukamurella paurometabola]|uniref:Acyl transferase n=1 Tax=Tsukamurella paurometabola (strain ATCC 8368 / DSM 20162 / CCUG 35730 / CIP 100753 / JCM 10117 / KCTC 9821 / NBRC 16120 / NCIMB 702349 / NCTC 13040) TaxID=521096 RepID=D5UZ35_TSUPD|nr:SDR family NAD(P)-dependent oxidoreductase [Tsukamurella paurometabola]ADG80882.1 Acyl transferase [Tsukamurella paurometabola DSM 20162]SUQ39248.1 Erythronolide synthase, modules 1 and 2 [Tsukamurella paurometabola]